VLDTELCRTRPSRTLAIVAAGAAASTAILGAAHPQLSASVSSRGDDLALVVAWAAAVAASAWLFAATGSCAVALRAGRPDVARRLAPALPPALRRLVEVAIVAAWVALPALPATAATSTSTTFPVVADEPVVRAPAAPLPAPAAPAPAVAAATPPVPTPASPSARVVVRPGDNLWLIARTSLTGVSTRRPTDSEVMRHWLVVIAANRSTLRSGDPSLIFPGEIVTVPPATAVS
jgi:hypothetical protein